MVINTMLVSLMIRVVLPRSISLNASQTLNLSSLNFRNVLSCFLTQKLSLFSLMVGVNIINCIITFRKMALSIEFLALTLSNKMALLRGSIDI
jgi:hypothetical protein